jgi:hypothetical protein
MSTCQNGQCGPGFIGLFEARPMVRRAEGACMGG